MRSRAFSLARAAALRPLAGAEEAELVDAMVSDDGAAWSAAAEALGVGTGSDPPGVPGGGTCSYAYGAAEDFLCEAALLGGMVVHNPHAAACFACFAPEAGFASRVASALHGGGETSEAVLGRAFARAYSDVAGGEAAPPADGQSAEDRALVACAAVAAGLLAVGRGRALLNFFGGQPK